MLSISDPCELKPSDIYRQARTVASKTSRGTDGHWYRAADALAWQWHLWFDGGREVRSATFSRTENRWQPGPVLPLVNLTTAEGVNAVLGEFMSTTFFTQKPKALGVILHVADEFALAEVGQSDAEGGDDFQILRYNLVDEPREVLADSEVSEDATTWRLLPFWGAAPGQPRCTAVALSRSREQFLQKLLACGEEMRVPVRVAVASAPVEALAAVPLILPQASRGCLIAMPYLKYTAVFAMTPAGELRSVRSLSHRGGSLVPTGFGDILWHMAISAELAGGESAGQGKPKIFLMSANTAALQAAAQDLEVYERNRQTIEFESIDLTTHPALAALPGNHPEFLVYDPACAEQISAGHLPMAGSESFRALWSGWAIQSFMDTVKLDTLYPSQRDLRLLQLSSWMIYLLVFALVSTGGYGTYSLFAAMNHPSWQLTPPQMKQTQDKLTKLQEEQKQINVTERLLRPRSRGWVTLEFLLQLFPEDSGVRLESFNYQMEASRPPLPASKGQKVEFTGMARTWSLKGLVKPKALELLNNLNSQRGLSAFFQRVADATGDTSYTPDSTRLLTVSLTQGRNPRYDSQAGPADVTRDAALAYAFNFEATITQTISEKDPLALPTEKPF